MKRTMLLISMLICMAMAPIGFAATDDGDTIALWHMQPGWYYIAFVLDDFSAGCRVQDLLVLGNPSNYADANYVPTPVASDCPVGDVNALQFDGVKSRASSQYSTWASYKAVAVDMYFKAQKNTGTQTLLEAPGTWSITLSGTNAVFTVYTSSSSRVYTVTNAVPALNTWHHVVASCDAAGNVSFQVDALTPQTGSGAALKIQTVGINAGHSAGTNLFQGILDEIKISAPGRLVQSDAAGVWGLWHMDAITDSNVLDDDSANPTRNNDLRLGDFDFAYPTASKPTLVSGVSGSALHFDGIQQEAAAKTLWPANYNKFNVDLWFNAETTSYTGPEVIVQPGSIWSISLSNLNGGNADLGITIWTTGDPRGISVTDAVSYDVWHHLILDVSETGHVVVTLDGTAVSTTDGLPVIQTSTAALTFGNKQGAGYTRWFQGSIDEVKITGSNVYVPSAPTAPAKDGPLTKALWHFDSINASFNFPDDDANHTTRNADLGRYAVGVKLNDNTSYPSCVDPVAAGIGYPSGNSAFANCAFFDAISGANCQVANTLMSIDGNDISVQGWIYLPSDFKLNQGLFSQAAHTYYWFDRWGQVAISAIETATTATDANSKVQFSCTTWDQNSTPVGGKVRYLTYTFSNTSSPSPYAWNHVKFTCLNKTISLYVNGILIQSSAVAGGLGIQSKTTTRIGARYNPQNYFYGYVDDVMIGKSTLKCGDSGYNAMDFNKDCMVNFKDVQALAAEWLSTNPYSGTSGSSNYPSLVEQKWANMGNYNIPKTNVVPTIDGVFNASEWADARTIELIYPSLQTAPNTAWCRQGTPSPSDYSVYCYVKWDNTYLYTAIVADDNVYTTNTGTGAYDLLQVCFNYLNIPTATYAVQALVIDTPVVGALNAHPELGGPASLPGSSLAGNSYTSPNRQVVEAKLKWSDIAIGNSGYVPVVGDKHGFVLFCQDTDVQSGARKNNIVTYSNPNTLATISAWSTITLANTIDCHEKLQSTKDFNNDCTVNFKDFSSFAQQWLNCTDQSGVTCH